MQLRTCNLQLATGNWQVIYLHCAVVAGLVKPDSSPDSSPDSTKPFAMAHSLQTLALESDSWGSGGLVLNS
ncbi:unnamed protein product [Ambrosiozyma monospora]|uniref:Unnamed protein product n=1 Tax=Ambrosiozyma monospora TaxID=43982 RepID=A0A9W7DDR5_AMBMO|nr:unnamed protein product [Ambrosiozyma monospora]